MAVEIRIKLNKNLNFLWESLDKILEARAKGLPDYQYLLLEGSSRSGKTWAILIFLISLCLNPQRVGKDKLIIRAFRHESETTSGTIVADFIEIMTTMFSGFNASAMEDVVETAFGAAGSYNITTKVYTFHNGSQIIFGGASKAGKLHGKKSDIVWFNEAMEILNDARSQLEFRTSLFLIADWNPSETDHWIFRSIMRNDRMYRYCHSTFKDNLDNLSAVNIYNIAKYEPTPENIKNGTADSWKWNVYGLGIRGVRDNLVFERWRWDIIDDDLFPHLNVCQREGLGLDYGYSQDPTALIDFRLRNDEIYLDELVYKDGLLVGRSFDNPNIPSLVGYMEELGIDKTRRIFPDQANPESNAQLRAAGYNVQNFDKGEINPGLDLLKQFRIKITRRSQRLISEFENYSYKKKPSGEITDVPEDKNNHGIDAARYVGKGILTQRITGGNTNARAVRRGRSYEEF